MELCVELDRPRGKYVPGDVITGRVIRTSQTICPRATVRISLHGMAKTKIVVDNHEHRGRFTLIHGHTTKQKLHDGPVRILPGLIHFQSWPFSLNMPARVEGYHAPPNWSEESSFIPFASELALPLSFDDRHSDEEASVEYYLEAEIELHGYAERGRETAITSIQMVGHHPGPPIEIPMTLVNTSHRLRSGTLIPGFQDVELTTSQKFKNMFKITPAPAFHFQLQSWLPTVLQMDYPEPLPIKMRVVPLWDKTSESLQGVTPAIKLSLVNPTVHTHIAIRAQGRVNPINEDWKHTTNLPSSRGHGAQVDIPCGEDAQPIDLGNVLGIRIPTTEEQVEGGKPKHHILYPALLLHNIQITHQLECTVQLKVAGCRITAHLKQDVKVLAAPGELTPRPSTVLDRGGPAGVSSTWTQPPPKYEEPPSFEEVQEHDRMKTAS